jgi:hypothetical protein
MSVEHVHGLVGRQKQEKLSGKEERTLWWGGGGFIKTVMVPQPTINPCLNGNLSNMREVSY